MAHERKQFPVDVLMVSKAPSFRDLVPLWVLLMDPRSEAYFPGISKAKLRFWGHGVVCPDRKNADQYLLEERCLAVGVLSGMFSAAGERSLIRRVLHSIGVSDSAKEYRSLIALAEGRETGSASLITALMLQYVGHTADPQDIIDWAFQNITMSYDRQERFLKAVEEFKQGAEIIWVPPNDPRDKPLYAALINSDNHEMRAAAFHMRPELIAVVQHFKTGHVRIFTNDSLTLPLKDFAAHIRQKELYLNGMQLAADDLWATLDQKGQLPIVSRWYLNERSLDNMILSAPDLPPTKLKFADFEHCVRMYLLKPMMESLYK